MRTSRQRLLSTESVHNKAIVTTTEVIVTEMEQEFMVALYEAIRDLITHDQKVSLKRLGEILDITTDELYDYIGEIVTLEERINKEVKDGYR